MNRTNQVVYSIVVLCVSLIAPAFCPASHPFHVSNAEVNWNPRSGNFEVALCLWPADLEKAISIDQAKPVDLDKVANLDELLKRYVEKRFLFRKSKTAQSDDAKNDAVAAPIRWVGHEKNLKTAWLYFEVEGDKTQAEWAIENRVFFELNEDQLNQVQLTIGNTSDTLICTPGAARHSLSTEMPVAKSAK